MLLQSGHPTLGVAEHNLFPTTTASSNHHQPINKITSSLQNNVVTTNSTLADPTIQSSYPHNYSIANTIPTTIQQPSFTNTGQSHQISVGKNISKLDQQDNTFRYLDLMQDTLKDGWTVHSTKDGRLYYCNHITRTAGWLPPAESWAHNIEFPYGWEKAVDSKGRSYYINHLNKTTTYEAPETYQYDDKPPEPRLVILTRSPTLGFGFVAGSEKPVIVRFVTEGGPSVHKLEPGDRILAVNGEDVKESPRDHVIQLVRSCETQVSLLVCQPLMNGCPGRKSTLLSAGKKAKLRSRPSRVRFAESVCVNGAPLFPPSAFALGDLCVPQMANVLKVFLENGQTKSFKYDSTTTVQDVVTSLRDKLCLSAEEHFSLVLEHVKSLKRNKLTLLDPKETLARVAARPGAHKLRCLFRITFVPISAALLAQNDLHSLDYLYMQCCNDVTQERFSPELQPDVALRLAALHIHQHSLANNISPAKLTVKTVEREFGLERFVPTSLIDGMKRKELRRLMAHFLKLNSQMTGSSSKMLTQLQAKIHYLDIISGLPSYGAKCFSTNQRDGVERVLLISPRFGLSQIAGVRNSVPQPICNIESLTRVQIIRDDDVTHSVTAFIQSDRFVTFSMEDRDACEFALVMAGYFKLLTGKDLPIDKEREEVDVEETAPPYLSQHSVIPSAWSYLPKVQDHPQSIAFLQPPSYHSVDEPPPAAINNLAIGGYEMINQNRCDRNMNTTLSNMNHTGPYPNKSTNNGCGSTDSDRINSMSDEFGFDIQSVMTMEILENTKGKHINGLIETRNEEVLRRVAEMQKMVENSEKYLNEHGELVHEYENKPNIRLPWRDSSIDFDSDCDSMNSSKVSSNEDVPPPGALKHSDSLVLLADSINLDLNGITKGLNIINDKNDSKREKAFGLNGKSADSQENTPKSQRRVHGLSQLLSDLHALSNDLSQSESDSESVCTPNSSPIHRNHSDRVNGSGNKIAIRTSFGLHSPDNSLLGPETKDTNLKEYLRQLKEASNKDGIDDTDLAAKKLTELYGFEIGDDTFIETDPDVIDLTAIPPPQTPDELDRFCVINQPPSEFDDKSSVISKFADNDGDLEKFLAKVIVAPPTQKITPAKELTPEEIMSFIIPPPPGLADDIESSSNNIFSKNTTDSRGGGEPVTLEFRESNSSDLDADYSGENLYINSRSHQHVSNFNDQIQSKQTIEYPTVERKGPFSCCTKVKKSEDGGSDGGKQSVINTFELPPRRCDHVAPQMPPERPPKNADLKMNTSPRSLSGSTTTNTARLNGGSSSGNYYELEPPKLPPRFDETQQPHSLTTLPPKKPYMPPIPLKPNITKPPTFSKFYNNHASGDKGKSLSPIRLAGIGSPYLNRNPNVYNEIDRAFTTNGSSPSPPPIIRSNGHFRSHSDCPPIPSNSDHRPQLSLLCSPQLSRRTSNDNTNGNLQPLNCYNGSPIHQYDQRSGQILNTELLLAKTDVAMAGLLVKLDQVAAQCSAAQAAGGGVLIDEEKFQRARDELTEQALQLVTASKLLVVAMSTPMAASLPEHLTTSLTALRRITELTQDMTRHTSSPLQTRNIVLKVHDVASSFRELAGVEMGPFGAGPLALQAECLANVLATLLRSLRVFSP